jgi:hypothetical protein
MADPVQRLRAIALALPDATEKLSHGEVAFFCSATKSARQFACVDDHHHGADHLAFWCPAPPGGQEELIASDPARFFRPPYVGHRGWIGVRIDNDPDWDEIAEIVRDAYRQVAPKTLVARLDG